jgi:hypothetical protein
MPHLPFFSLAPSLLMRLELSRRVSDCVGEKDLCMERRGQYITISKHAYLCARTYHAFRANGCARLCNPAAIHMRAMLIYVEAVR